MADDKVAIWGSGLKFGRKPANGELLIGNGEDMTMATLTAGAGATITNAAGAITISATGTGIGTVTASSPLASSGGSSPDISLTGTVGVANGGTGRSSLTANNVVLGNGTSAVGLVAPGASGNVLTSNGTTWSSSASPYPWVRSYITSPQAFFSNATFANLSGLQFSVVSGLTYYFRSFVIISAAGAGGAKLSVNGPAQSFLFFSNNNGFALTTYDGIVSSNAGPNSFIINISGIVTPTANGTVFIRGSQSGVSPDITIFYENSWIEWMVKT